MIEQVVLLSSALLGFGEGKVELPLSEALQRIDARLSECFAMDGIPFGEDARCRPILDIDNKIIGFETRIDGRPLAFDLDGYTINPESSPEFYSSGTAGMTSFADLVSMNGFSPLSCVCQIPTLVSLFGSSSFGNWEIVSFNSGADDCAQIASMDLIYTYRLTNSINPSIYDTSSDLYDALLSSQNHQPGLGITLTDYLPGLNAVLTSDYGACAANYNAARPVVGAYSPSSGNTGHFAMKVGEAETTAFWFIKTQWDIVVSEERNYYGTEPNTINHQKETCFFGIESSRRQATFALFGC